MSRNTDTCVSDSGIGAENSSLLEDSEQMEYFYGEEICNYLTCKNPEPLLACQIAPSTGSTTPLAATTFG